MLRLLRVVTTHGLAAMAGFAMGIFLLPILVAPDAPSDAAVAAAAGRANFTGEFVRDLPGSDFLHWGEGTISLSQDQISFTGSLAPGPDYKLYLTPELVTSEREFLDIKDKSVRIGDIRTFNNFIVPIPEGTKLEDHTAVLIWCESFGEFITAASYR